ncbi:MAG: FHA domain-containing protein [Planctomycetes bacterium]|nr:FHA domain-containing protein [Planctomycetota bacterium]
MKSPVSAEGTPLLEVVKQLTAVSKDDFLLQVEAPLLLEVPTDGVLPAGYGDVPKPSKPGEAVVNTVAVDAVRLANLPRQRNLAGAKVYLLEGATGEGSCLIGREGCVVTLSNEGVSRKHAEVHAGGGNWFLVDLQSHNGSYVNKQKVTPGERVPLEDRCSVWLGSFRGVFLSPDEFFDLVGVLAKGK